VLFPPAEYKHESKDANTDKDAPDIELVTCTATVRAHDKLLGKTLEAYQMLIVLLQ
jgi:hypothetical protein